MKNFSLIAATALALVLAPAALALAEGALYVTPKLGFSNVTAKFDDESKSKNLVPFGLAVGYDFNPVRAELEYAYRAKKEFFNETEEYGDLSGSLKGKLGVETLFLNGYYDIHNSSSITPYVGLGLGLAKLSYEAALDIKAGGSSLYWERLSGTKTKFAWNIGAGAAWQLSDLLSLDLGYRYADFGKFTVESGPGFYLDNFDVKSSAHEVLLGLRFSF